MIYPLLHLRSPYSRLAAANHGLARIHENQMEIRRGGLSTWMPLLS